MSIDMNGRVIATSMAELSSGQTSELLRYLVLHSAEEGQSLVGRVRLTKLLFLTELEFFRAYRRRLTDLQWVFYHYGPYVMSIEERFRSLPFRETDDHESGLRGWRVQEWEARGLDHLEIPERVERVADEVCRRWATEEARQAA